LGIIFPERIKNAVPIISPIMDIMIIATSEAGKSVVM